MQDLGSQCKIVRAKLASSEDGRNVASKVLMHYARIDILLNCAGVQSRHLAEEFPDEDWERVKPVNLHAVSILCLDFGAAMLRQLPHPPTQAKGIDHQCGFSSLVLGRRYCTRVCCFEGRMEQLTRTLSNGWSGKGIDANAVELGHIDTQMNTAFMNNKKRAEGILARIRAGRWGSPDDFRETIITLTSAASQYVNGEIMKVDGGWMWR